MNKCSVVMPYYKARTLLEWQLTLWSSYPEEIRKNLFFIIVDDGSPVDKAKDVLLENIGRIKADSLNIELYEVLIDKIWNSEGASNLGIQQVQTDRFIRIDFDYHFPTESMEKILNIPLDKDEWYNFKVVKHGTHEELMSHVNTYFMMKETFWKSGGYDEDFCGHYGWTDLLLERIFAKYAKQIIRNDILLVTCPFESAHGLDRDGERNRLLLEQKTAEYCYATDFTKEIIRFPWRKVEWDT